MLIRPAEERDARAIASFIVMAESEMVSFFTGTEDTDKAVDFLLRFVLSPVSNRYSLHNNTVMEEDGKAAASLVSFPADSQPDLDGPVLESLKKRGFEHDKLFFEGEPGTYYLSTMGVNPEYRGRGFGTALMKNAFKTAREKGFDRVSLLVSKDKPKAQALYERLGFAAVTNVRMGDVEYVRMARKV